MEQTPPSAVLSPASLGGYVAIAIIATIVALWSGISMLFAGFSVFSLACLVIFACIAAAAFWLPTKVGRAVLEQCAKVFDGVESGQTVSLRCDFEKERALLFSSAVDAAQGEASSGGEPVVIPYSNMALVAQLGADASCPVYAMLVRSGKIECFSVENLDAAQRTGLFALLKASGVKVFPSGVFCSNDIVI